MLKNYIKQNSLCENSDSIKHIFAVFLLCQHLLRIAQRSNMLFIDATYRIIDLDYPIIALVVLDTNVMFILINIAIVSDESAEIYLCVLKMLQEEIEKNGGIFNPTHIILD
ncbi:hypothetical protein BB558_001125 [Smittium angustum]|uniref:MULE transposase domain-containing protein n=1 Tax=Smittium angustum TaxID=133377 RepID=A0A2U1JCI1_SMIAN|nr:hypothetical protein BB558_001125 [Smittium angustum]